MMGSRSPSRGSVPCAFLQTTHHWGGLPQSKQEERSVDGPCNFAGQFKPPREARVKRGHPTGYGLRATRCKALATQRKPPSCSTPRRPPLNGRCGAKARRYTSDALCRARPAAPSAPGMLTTDGAGGCVGTYQGDTAATGPQGHRVTHSRERSALPTRTDRDEPTLRHAPHREASTLRGLPNATPPPAASARSARFNPGSHCCRLGTLGCGATGEHRQTGTQTRARPPADPCTRAHQTQRSGNT